MSLFTRRQTLWLAGGAALGTIAGARLLLRPRFAPTPYDDLIALLPDRDGSAQIGETLLAQMGDFEPVILAEKLRRHMAGRMLADVAAEDAGEGRLIEANGWVLPETAGLICALAAKAAG